MEKMLKMKLAKENEEKEVMTLNRHLFLPKN